MPYIYYGHFTTKEKESQSKNRRKGKMTLNEIISKNITNGHFFAIETETEGKRKGITYRKRTTCTAQFGVNYANVASVQDKLEQ